MKSTLMPIFGLTVSVVTAVASGQDVTMTAKQQARAGVDVRSVEEATFDDRTRVLGQVVRSPGSTVTVTTILAGRVEVLNVAPGDSVARGQLMVELHSHDLLAVQGDLLRAADSAQLAATRHEAGKELFQLEGISRLDLEAREQEAFAARLELEAARAELLDLGFTVGDVEELMSSRQTDPHLPIDAPLDGTILELKVQQHQWVQAFEPVLVLGDPGQVELELQIPPDQVAAVNRGDRVEFAPVGRPQLAGVGTVISRVPQVDPETRTVRVRARIEESSQFAVFPGVFIDGVVVHGAARTAPSVPESAVIRLGRDDVVFVRTGPENFEARVVELGVFNGARYLVRSGVAAGDDVVVEGVFLLKSALVTGESEEE